MFANHLPRVGVLNGNCDRTGRVRGGREEYAIIYSFFCFFLRYMPVFTLSASFNSICWEWNLTFFRFYDCFFCSDTGLFLPCRRHLRSICREWYHVQRLTHTYLTPVLRGQSITNAPLNTQSTQVPHVSLKNLSRQTT